VLVAVFVVTAGLGAADPRSAAESTQRESRRRFQEQELTVSPATFLVTRDQPPPRIIWRDVDEVRRLGGDGVLRVRWFDAELNERNAPDKPGRWGAYVEGTAPNGTPVRRAMTFYCRPPGFLFYLPAASPCPPPHQPGPIDAAVWGEHRDEIAGAAAQSWFDALNRTEAGAILIAGLTESTPLGRSPTATETAAALNEDYHLRLKLKVLGLAGKTRPLAPPRPRRQGPAPVLRDGPACEAGMTKDARAAIESVCEAWARESGEPFVALVARHGVIVTHRAYGRDASGADVSLDYRNCVFSITKTLTAILFSQFVDQGLIDLDDSVAKVFPDFPDDPGRVPTFRQCLTHTSGLSGHGDWGGSTNPHFENIILNGVDANEPGKAYAYSGAGFDLTAKAMEVVTGKSWRRIFRDHLFEPLGLGDVPMDNASAGARLTAFELAAFGQWLSNRGSYGDREFITLATSERLLPEQLGDRYHGVTAEEGIGMHWMNVPRPGPAAQPGHSPRTLLGPRTVGHGSLSGCTLLVDLERELVIVQVRRQAGPKYGEWLPRFVQAAVESSATH